MSNIPKARRLIIAIIMNTQRKKLKRQLGKALALMTRAKYVRHARPVSQAITAKQKRLVRKLNPNLNLTQTDIALKAGLRNAGRVSEILNGKK